MTTPRRRISGVTVLAAAVLVLLPALAWLQYSWLDQISVADRERRARTLQTAAGQLAQDFENELARAVSGLQIEAQTVEQGTWARYAARYDAWEDSAIAPEIVEAVYYVPGPDAPGARAAGRKLPDGGSEVPPLHVWNHATQSFDEVAWPAELAAIRLRFMHDARRLDLLGPQGRGGRGLLTALSTGDERSFFVPILRVMPAAHGGRAEGRPSGPPDVRLLGFTIIRLDLGAVGSEVLPALVRRHLFDDRGHTDYHVAVVSRADPARVVYESASGAAAEAVRSPDVDQPLLGDRVRPFLFMARDLRGGGLNGRAPEARGGRGERERSAPPRTADDVLVDVIESRQGERGTIVEARVASAGDAQWRLVATHRAGSLEAAVAATRTRNFVLSSGILLLLGAAIALLVVSTRRADRLARQQLEFVAAVSHELRTPVSVIGAAAGNLADGVVGDPSRVKTYGATIQTEARRLAETVERVLQLAGLAAGRGTSADTRLSPDALVRDAVQATQHDIDRLGASLELQIAPDLPPVAGDGAALRSALQNLISNALKYGGPAPFVQVSAARQGPRAVQVAVKDRGVGIAAEDRRHIFEPFYRGREAVARQIQGSGLGLHLVRRIVEAHGGSVSVQSEPQRGSTFTIVLPAAPQQSGHGADAHEHSPSEVRI